MSTTATPRRAAALAKIATMDSQLVSFDYDVATGNIWLDGDIGDHPGEISSRAVRAALQEIGNKRLTIYLNSGGGSVIEGWAIYRQLVGHRAGVTTIVSPLAASMAAVIFQAGQERLIDANGILMIHNPWTNTSGNANELQQSIDLLRKIETQMVDVFSNRTGLDKPEISRMLSAETWLDAGEAVKLGFADSIASDAYARTLTIKRVRLVGDAQCPNRLAAKTRIAWTKGRLMLNGVL